MANGDKAQNAAPRAKDKAGIGLLRAGALAVVPLLVGAVAFWLQPVRSMVSHWIWGEDVGLQVTIGTSKIEEGDEFEVHIYAYPKSPLEVSGGILKVGIAPDVAVPLGGAAPLPTPAFANPTVLTAAKPVRFAAVAPGDATLTVTLDTKARRYSATQPVRVHVRSAGGTPSRRNYSGRWHLRVGEHGGQMDIIEKGVIFSGRYSLDDGTQGVVDALRDGDVFEGSLFRGSSSLKWIVRAKVQEVGDSLKIEGRAEPRIAMPDGWQPKGAAIPFLATARVSQRRSVE